MRGRAAEGGRGALSHVLAEPKISDRAPRVGAACGVARRVSRIYGKLSSVTLPVMSCSRSRWINVGSGYVRNHKDTETQRAQGKRGQKGLILFFPVPFVSLCLCGLY
jgi:hypothetical protein